MVAFGVAADVDIFSHFDIAFGAQNHCPTISPGTETSRSEPIHSEIGGRTVVRNQGSVTEIFKFRILLIRVVTHSRGSNGGVGSPGIKKELFDLMAADVAQNAAIFRFFEEPGRPRIGIQAM